MIKEDELSRLLAEAEADRIERTASTKDTDKFSEAVTAFSNDLPNHRLPVIWVIGVDEQRKTPRIEVTDQLLQTLGGPKIRWQYTALAVAERLRSSACPAGMSRSWKCFLPTYPGALQGPGLHSGRSTKSYRQPARRADPHRKADRPRATFDACHVSAVPWRARYRHLPSYLFEPGCGALRSSRKTIATWLRN